MFTEFQLMCKVETPGQAENEDEKYSERLDAILYSFFSELHLLPSLSALTLMFWTRPVDNSEVPPNIAPRQASVIRGILPVDGSLRTLEANPQLMIKKLKIDGLFLVWMPIRINFLAMLSYFPKLCHVDVTFMRDSDVCSLFQHHRERMAHPFVISAPPWESTLSVLTLRADKGLSCLLGIDNCPAYFSQLSHLSLDRVRFGINDAVERFVLRHSSTLQYLQLCSCAAHIGRDPNDPVAGTRTWASIYSVFSLQLSSLIDLSVLTFYEHERLGEYVNAYGLDNGMQTLLSHPVSVPVPETQTQMDNDALLVFIRVVEDRKFRKR